MRRLQRLVIVVLALLAVASLSFSGGRTFELIDSAGGPADPVYIAYSYAGSRLNPVHPVTYEANPLALARSDGTGRVAIAATAHAHLPFPLETHPSLRIELVYVPRLHNAWGQLNAQSPSQPGVFEIDASRRQAVVANLEDRPELWQGSLTNLSSLIQRLITARPGRRPLRETDPYTAGLARELIRHFRAEYDAFLARYRDVDRVPPELPGYLRLSSLEEQRRWTESTAADLRREPRWGILTTRRFDGELQLSEQWAAEPR